MFGRDRIRTTLAVLLLLGGVAYAASADFFGLELIAEIAVFAILVMSLDLLAGFGGMISLGHAAFFGLGAYLFALMTAMWSWPPLVAMIATPPVIAGIAVLVGFVVVRVHGIFFIMITLALGEMAHAYFFESRLFGGDDGLAGIPRLDLSALGLELHDPRTFALALIALAALVYLLLAAVLRAPFGHVLIGIRINEHRMRALGCPTARYKIGAFAAAAAVAGLAGTLRAQHTQFITPVLLEWTTSGEALIMVILGGLRTLIGPVIGAAAVTLLRHELSAWTDYWSLFLGLFLIAVVLSRRNGIYGWLAWLGARVSKRRAAPAPEKPDAAR